MSRIYTHQLTQRNPVLLPDNPDKLISSIQGVPGNMFIVINSELRSFRQILDTSTTNICTLFRQFLQKKIIAKNAILDPLRPLCQNKVSLYLFLSLPPCINDRHCVTLRQSTVMGM